MVHSRAELVAAVDRLLQEQGRFDGVQLLEALGLLEPGDSEEPAVERLSCPRPEAETLTQLAQDYADSLALRRCSPPLALALAEAMGRLRPAAYGLEEQLRQVRERASGQPQMDLFQDNRLAHAEAALRAAVVEQRLDQARRMAEQLPDDAAGRKARLAWQRLIEADAVEVEEPQAFLRLLQAELAPLARFRLGRQATVYLRRLWHRLGLALADSPFLADQPALHASHAWQQAGEWSRVCGSVDSEPQWRSQPVLMQRLAEARQRLGETGPARGLWLELCWHHPEVAETALSQERADATLNAHWQRFLDAEPVLETADFPAWLLLVDAALSGCPLPDEAPDSPPGGLYKTTHRLRANGGAMAERRQLQALSPRLLQHYLALHQPRRGATA
jgi:hypothetical protein